MQETSRFKLGLFVVFSLGVFVLTISALGVFDRFSEKVQLVTLVQESVQGLNAGSAVKYRGVPIGKVSDITLDTEGKLIRIHMSIDLSKFKAKAKSGPEYNVVDISQEDFFSFLTKDMEEGLRCQIEPDGITGMKYIELDFSKEPEDKNTHFMALGYNASTGLFYIPSVPSLFSDLRVSLTSIINKLESVDYKGISDKTIATLDSADKLFNDPAVINSLNNIESSSEKLNKTLTTLNESLTTERIDGIVTRADEAITSIRKLSDTTTETIDSSDIAKTAQTLRDSLNSFHRSNRFFVESMMKLNEGMDALIELIQYIDSDPAALLMGKNKPMTIESNSDDRRR